MGEGRGLRRSIKPVYASFILRGVQTNCAGGLDQVLEFESSTSGDDPDCFQKFKKCHKCHQLSRRMLQLFVSITLDFVCVSDFYIVGNILREQ